VLAAYDAEGRLDRGFGDDGVLAFGALGTFGKVTLDSAGRIIVLGGPARASGTTAPSGVDAVIVRVLPDGRLDPSFGFGGVQRQESPTLIPKDVHSDGSGGVLVLERDPSEPRLFVVFRVTPDGVVDRSYGADGVAVLPRIGEFDLTAYTVDATGRFVAVDSIGEEGDGMPARYALVGLDASGRPDSALGEQGTRDLDFGPGEHWASDVEIDALGRYVILGGGDSTFIARYLADGTPDASWSGTADGLREILPDGNLPGTGLSTLTIDGTTYYADGVRYGPSGRHRGDSVVVRVDDETEQVWTSRTRRFKFGLDVLSVRDGTVLALADVINGRHPRQRITSLARLRFD
jgi:hypothetical protein